MTPVIAVFSLGYFGERSFDSGNNLPTVNSVVESARSLRGSPYDPLMGMYENIGAKLGFLVCSDVPNIAYGLAGYSWKTVLEDDFRIHTSAYDTSNGNTPNNPYFHRRARNLYNYFKANNRLKIKNYTPSIGDLVFYRKNSKGYIAHVTLVTEVGPDNYSVMESAPRTILAQEVDGKSPLERGWIFAGFGSVY